MTDPLLEVEDRNVYYGKSHALKGLSLSITEVEIYGVIGPNGAGKTTILNAIAGFVE